MLPLPGGCPLEDGAHLFEIDHSDLVHAASGHVGEMPIRRDDDVGRVREVVVGFVEQELIDPPVRPQDAETVGQNPALDHPCHGDQVLCADQGDEGEGAVRRHVDPLDHVGVGDHDAVGDVRRAGVDNRDL